MNSRKILVADDEPDMLGIVSRALEREGFILNTASNGEMAWNLIRSQRPDLAILDMMMPGMSGAEICRAVRKDPAVAHVPLIIISARTDEIDLVAAFEDGVDDYVTKPFSPRELVLRVKAILRNVPAREHSGTFVLGDVLLDPIQRTVYVAREEVSMTTNEYKLLLHFLAAPERVHSRTELLKKVWGEQGLELRSVDTQVRRLRDRLGVAATQIETVRSFGYRMTGK